MIRIFLFLLIVQMLTPAAAKPGFVNLATTARIKASSEPKNQRLMAGVVADGRVAPALFHYLEFYPVARVRKVVGGPTKKRKEAQRGLD
ncbi:MAG: hypothetical protein CMO40_07925 [Verrucomicrobiaceae bacterium]|nr:hypothetical protein [Verrucomicrobiaceae bacterium]